MSFTVPTFEQLRDRYLQAIVNQQPEAAIGPDSDNFVRACAQAAVLEGVYAHQAWVFRQAFPDLADADVMERMANQRGLVRKPAAIAAGTVRFTGDVGTVVPIGQQVFTAQGAYFQTTAAGAIGGGGTVDLAATALVAGASGNQANNTPATASAPPAGIAAAATVLAMTGGANVESDADLLDRLLLDMSEIAQGGNEVDFERWTREVPGVKRAHVYNVRRGPGTVDVVPLPETGMPSAPLLAAVQALLDQRRPVGMSNVSPVLALAPTQLVQAVTAALTLAAGYTLAGVTPAVLAAIERVFAELKPGATLVRNKLITAILNVPGVTDVNLTAPAANVGSLVDATHLEMVTLGVANIT